RGGIHEFVRDSERVNRLIEEVSGEGFFIADANDKIVFASKKMADLLGYHADEMVGKSYRDFLNEHSRILLKDKQVEIGRNAPLVMDLEFRRKLATDVWTIFSSTPVYDEVNNPMGLLATVTEITDPKKTEKDCQLLASIVDSSDDAITGKTLDGIITSWNLGATRLYGYSADEVIGKSMSLLIPLESGDELARTLGKIRRGEHIEHFETLRRRKDGKLIDVSLTVSPIKDVHGNIVGASTIARDITGRKRTEERIKLVNSYNRRLIEASQDPLVTIAPDGRITDVNKATENAVGLSRDKLIGTDFSYYFTDPVRAKEGYMRVFEVGSVTDYPLEIRHRDGHTTPVLYNASVYKDETGKVIGVFAAARDITERRRAEEAAHIASAYNRRLIEASLDPMVTISPDGVIMDVNKATENVTGYLRGDLIGTDFSVYFTDPEKALEGYRAVFEKGSVRDYPLEIRNKNGRVTPVLYNAAVYQDKTGKVVGVFAAARDMTERKMAEEKIDRQIMLIDLSPDAIMVRRLDGTIMFWSRGAESLYGWKKDEAMGKQTHSLFQTRFPEPLSKINEQLARTGRWSGELVHTTKDGRHVTVQSWWLARGAKPGQIDEILESNIDITELKRTQLLAEQTTRLQEQARIIDLAHVIIRDPNSRIISWTSGDELLYGYTKEEAVGMVSNKLFQTVFPVSKEAVDESLELTGHWQGELVHLAKDGHKVVVASHQVLYREHGKPVAILEVNNDITEQKRLENQLRDAKNRAELYLDIMGHDINNLNQVTVGNLDLIRGDENLTGEQRDIVSDALNAARGSASIIDNVRKIQAIHEKREIMLTEDLNELILSCIREAPKPVGRNMVINYEPRSGLMIRGTALMKEVFCNLINNAIKHSSMDIIIDIGVDAVDRYGKGFYEVSIADNGPGVPDELKPKLFYRFQRGDTKAHGRGLGLFIARSLVEQAGGDITITDRIHGEPERGAKFIVSLPVCEVS
ncbi:MAG TPA: PAS domain S-box protein, partial [Methanocella sp.]|nr:PAS domain S-box protein [Methanocella sp.]